METPCIITVAITGAVPTKDDSPAVPVTPQEQIESTHEAFEAGATVVHVHVRNEDQTPSSDPELFAQVKEGIERHCKGMVVQFSTGGRGRSLSERGSMLHLRPDMASLATGSTNFPKAVYENPPDFVEDLARQMLEREVKPEIEVFDLAMLYNGAKLVEQGFVKAPPHVQFVMGVPNAMPARCSVFEFLMREVQDVLPGATWTGAGIGRHQLEVNHWSLKFGGHCRTGLEDNLKYDRDRLARSNAELVARVTETCAGYDRRPATVAETREILHLRPV